MTPVSHLASKMEEAAAGLRKWDAAAMRDAAVELEAAAHEMDPEADLVGGLRRLNGAVARAARLYGQKTGRALFPGGSITAPVEQEDGAA